MAMVVDFLSGFRPEFNPRGGDPRLGVLFVICVLTVWLHARLVTVSAGTVAVKWQRAPWRRRWVPTHEGRAFVLPFFEVLHRDKDGALIVLPNSSNRARVNTRSVVRTVSSRFNVEIVATVEYSVSNPVEYIANEFDAGASPADQVRAIVEERMRSFVIPSGIDPRAVGALVRRKLTTKSTTSPALTFDVVEIPCLQICLDADPNIIRAFGVSMDDASAARK